MTARRIARASRLGADLERAVGFSRDALGVRRIDGGAPWGTVLAALGGPARQAVMLLGEIASLQKPNGP